MMVEFLHGKALSRGIRKVVKGENLVCAVAFWGDGAVRELFGKPQLTRQDVKIVCDLSMGATSPETLRQLGAPNNERLRHYSGLHAKVYRSDAGMVVGSANASNNGIGFMGEGAGLLETGVFLKPNRATWQKALRWFDEDLWEEATQIDNAALEYCEARWRARQRAGRRENPPNFRARPSFLAVLRDEPWLFGDVKFVITDGAFPPDEQQENIEAALEEGHQEAELQDRVQFGDFGTETVEDWPLRFIELHIPRERLYVYFRTRGDMVDDIHFAHRSGIRRPDFNDIYIQMTQVIDENILAQCLERLQGVRDHEDARIWSAEELSERLFRRRNA